MKDNYASGSMVIAGLYDEHELAALHARINAAHDTLFAPDRRRLYDLALPEADLARAVRAAAQVSAPAAGGSRARRRRGPPRGARVRHRRNAEVTGAFLKKVREIRGLELNDISQRTKISERYLRALEDEQFARHAGGRLRARLRHRVRARAAPRPAARGGELPGALPGQAAQGRARPVGLRLIGGRTRRPGRRDPSACVKVRAGSFDLGPGFGFDIRERRPRRSLRDPTS